MAGKLATLVALFSLVLSAAAFASPADVDLVGETEIEAGAGAGELEANVGEHEQEEEEFMLYLGPRRDETIAGSEDRRVD